MKKISKWLILLLLLGLFLRIFITFSSFQFRENTDVLRWRDWGRIAYLHGLEDTFKKDHITFGTLPNNMPPGTLYIVAGMYDLNMQASKAVLKIFDAEEGSLGWVNVEMLNFFLRLPSIIADLIIAYLIYLIIKRKTSENRALLGSSLYLFNPVVFYNSAFWGQMDSLNNLMFFLALYFLLKNKYFFAVLFTFLSLYIKFSLLPLMPILFYLLYASKNLSAKKLILFIIASLVIIIILTTPISHANLFWLIDYLKSNSLGEMQFITNFAFNFWWMIFQPSIQIGDPSTPFSFSEVRLINSPLDRTNFLFISLQAWAIGLFTIFCVPLIRKIYVLKEKMLNSQNLFLLFCILTALIFLFLPRMHERYLYPFFPLMATLIGLSNRYVKTFIILSVLNFINLYIVWHPMNLWFLPYNVINNSTFQWLVSLGIVLTIIIFYIKTYRFGFNYEKKK